MMEKPLWQKFLYSIWPSIYRTINGVIIFIFRVLKATVRIGVKQVKEV